MAFANTVVVEKCGGAEVMVCKRVELAPPAAGMVQVRQAFCGVNFVDVYFRSGVYPQPFPAGLGMEASGVVEALGAGVTQWRVGDRVAYAGGANGAYADVRNVPEHLLIKLPDAVTLEQAAAVMLKGLTVNYLFSRTYRLQPGQTILFHAAAGGVGLLACQWAAHLGVTMIGTVGSEEKVTLAREYGCQHVINYRRENFAQRVKEITNGKGVDVVYDSIGKDTWARSLDCLKPRGLMVSFGNASGVVPDFSPLELTKRGSLFFTRPALAHYIAERSEYLALATELFSLLQKGQLRSNVSRTFALAQVQEAHHALESRTSSGSLLLYTCETL